MGPRNTRRLAVAAVVLGVIAAIAVAVVVLSGGSSSPSSGPFGGPVRYQGPTDARYDANSLKLIFGMTKRQVQRLVGPPERIVGRCWQYRVNKVLRDGSISNADRVCFDGGHYSDLQFENNGQWNPKPSVPVFTQ